MFLTSKQSINFAMIGVTALALSACGGGGGGDSKGEGDPTPAPSVSSLKLNQAELKGDTASNQALTLGTLNLADIKINNQAATADQFKQVSFSLSGANANLFSINKSDSSVQLLFNQPASDIALGTCANDACSATLKATLNQQSANLALNVALTSYSFAFENNSISQTLFNNPNTVVLTDVKSLLRYGGKPLAANQNVTLTLDGADKSVFALANNQLSYANGSCAAEACSLTLTAKLGDQTATANASVTLKTPLKVKANPFAKVTSSYVVVPYNQDGLGETYVGGRKAMDGNYYGCVAGLVGGSGFCMELLTSGDGMEKKGPSPIPGVTFNSPPPKVGIESQSVPIFPFLLVKDDGKCIVEAESQPCATTAETASLEQKKAYLERVALTAEEFKLLDIKIKGFTQSEQPLPNVINKHHSNFGITPDDFVPPVPSPTPCRGEYPCYLLRKPDVNSSESDEVADAQRFKIESKTTDFFTNQLEGYKQYQNNFVTAHAADLKSTYSKTDTSDWQYVYSAEQEVFNKKYAGKEIPVLTVGSYQWKGIHASFKNTMKLYTGGGVAALNKEAVNMHHFPPNSREIDVSDSSGHKSPMYEYFGAALHLPAIPVMLYPLDIQVASKEVGDNKVDLNIKLFNVSACRGSGANIPLLTNNEDGEAKNNPGDQDKQDAYNQARANNLHLFEKSAYGYDPVVDQMSNPAYQPKDETGVSSLINTKIYSHLRTNHAAPGYSFIERFWSAKKKTRTYSNYKQGWQVDGDLDPRPELAALKSKKTAKGLSPEEFELANAILNLCPSAKDVSGADGSARN